MIHIGRYVELRERQTACWWIHPHAFSPLFVPNPNTVNNSTGSSDPIGKLDLGETLVAELNLMLNVDLSDRWTAKEKMITPAKGRLR